MSSMIIDCSFRIFVHFDGVSVSGIQLPTKFLPITPFVIKEPWGCGGLVLQEEYTPSIVSIAARSSHRLLLTTLCGLSHIRVDFS